MNSSVSAEHACSATTSSASPSARIAARRSVALNRLNAGAAEQRRGREGVEPILVVGGPDAVPDRQDDGADAAFARHSR